MKYKVSIEGGFSGIPRLYQGELSWRGEDARALLGALDKAGTMGHKNWPDMQEYHIEITEGDETCQARIPESNLPRIVRKFIDAVRDESQTKGRS